MENKITIKTPDHEKSTFTEKEIKLICDVALDSCLNNETFLRDMIDDMYHTAQVDEEEASMHHLSFLTRALADLMKCKKLLFEKFWSPTCNDCINKSEEFKELITDEPITKN
jgi:hypothetical protein